jgi:hypothetical protein
MGHRANFVLVDGDGWRLHYSHWAANGIYSSLAAGPGAATRFIAAQQVWDRATGWLDDTWAEGGAVVDHVVRHLIFYGNDVLLEIPIKRAFVALLSRTWPGWQVSWAYDGIGDLAAHVGVDRRIVRSPNADERRMPERVEEDLDWPVHLVTVRSGTGRLVAYPFRDCHTAWQGPALVDRLPGPGVARLDLSELPASGLHVDVAGRQVGVWMSQWGTGLVPALVELWPGWTVTFWGDRYEEQLALCGDVVAVAPVDPAAAVDELEAALERGRDRDPVRRALEVVELHRGDGREVEVSPAFTAHQQVAPTETEWEAVRAAIAALR